MKKALIIGAAGFVGSYLIDCLHDEFGYEVYATKLPGTEFTHDKAEVYDLDILKKKILRNYCTKFCRTVFFTLRHRALSRCHGRIRF